MITVRGQTGLFFLEKCVRCAPLHEYTGQKLNFHRETQESKTLIPPEMIAEQIVKRWGIND